MRSPPSRAGAPGNLHQGPHRRLRKHVGNLRRNRHHVRTRSESLDVLPTDQPPEVRALVFGTKFVRDNLLSFPHRASSQPAPQGERQSSELRRRDVRVRPTTRRPEVQDRHPFPKADRGTRPQPRRRRPHVPVSSPRTSPQTRRSPQITRTPRDRSQPIPNSIPFPLNAAPAAPPARNHPPC